MGTTGSPALQTALLQSARDLERGGVAFPVRWRGVGTVELHISDDGSCSVVQATGQQHSCPGMIASLFQRGSCNLPLQIPSANIVGATTQGAALVVWHAPLKSGKSDKPRRRLHHTPPLLLESAQQAEQAAAQLRRACCWQGRQEPLKLMVVVNPASGPGRAPSIYSKQVKPLLEAAGCHVEMHLTTARAHATELVKAVAPGSFDAIVAIGGDGTLHEVLQGILSRDDWEAMRHTPLAQIPCGSGNALAASCGMWDVCTALHAVIKGRQQPLDIASVLQHSPTPSRCFSFLSLNFGLIANLDIGTEHLRWMGGLRFYVGAVQQILWKRRHRIRVAMLEAKPAASGITAAAAAAAAAASIADAADGSLPVAQSSEKQRLQQQLQQALAQAASQPGPAVQQLAAFQQLAGDQGPEAAAGAAPQQQLPPGWQLLPEREMQLFFASNLPRLDMTALMAPDARLDSGSFNLIYNQYAGRLKSIEIMLATDTGAHMPLVKQRLVAAMALHPESSGTWLVVDGEAVPYTPLFMEVHPSLCTVVTAPAPSSRSS